MRNGERRSCEHESPKQQTELDTMRTSSTQSCLNRGQGESRRADRGETRTDSNGINQVRGHKARLPVGQFRCSTVRAHDTPDQLKGSHVRVHVKEGQPQLPGAMLGRLRHRAEKSSCLTAQPLLDKRGSAMLTEVAVQPMPSPVWTQESGGYVSTEYICN